MNVDKATSRVNPINIKSEMSTSITDTTSPIPKRVAKAGDCNQSLGHRYVRKLHIDKLQTAATRVRPATQSDARNSDAKIPKVSRPATNQRVSDSRASAMASTGRHPRPLLASTTASTNSSNAPVPVMSKSSQPPITRPSSSAPSTSAPRILPICTTKPRILSASTVTPRIPPTSTATPTRIPPTSTATPTRILPTSTATPTRILPTSTATPTRSFVSSRTSDAPETHRSSIRSIPNSMISHSHRPLQVLRSLIGKQIQIPQSNSPPTTSDLKKSVAQRENGQVHAGTAAAKTTNNGARLPKPRSVGGVAQPSISRPTLRPLLNQSSNSGRYPSGDRTVPSSVTASALRGGHGPQRNRGLLIAAQRIRCTGRVYSSDPYGLDDPDDEDLSFIDDGPLDDSTDEMQWKSALRGVTGYNPALYEDEGEATESSLTQQELEEMRSSQLAAAEDALEQRKLQMEEQERRSKAKEKRKGDR